MMPPRPEPIVAVTPDGKRFYVDLDVQIYRAYELEPRTELEAEVAEREGKIYRILYCTATYDVAVTQAEKQLSLGRKPERIEFVHADRDELRAFKQQKFVLREIPETA